MTVLEEIMAFNREFVANREYERFDAGKFPLKKLAVLACMDTRLTELLPAAMNCKNGDMKIIKNAGALITHPFGSVMRSLLIAVYELGVEEIAVIGHYDCGMQGLDPVKLLHAMQGRGVSREQIDMIRYCGVDIEAWMQGFDKPEDSVRQSVRLIRRHPLIPKDVPVHGLLIDPVTGRLDLLPD